VAEHDAHFPDFLEAMRGRRLIHVGHREADPDALGSAYAMSCVLPGDVGCARGITAAARDLAAWLGIDLLIDPDLASYDYVAFYDSINADLVGLPLPARYALFDHHNLLGGHRYGSFYNELADGAEWCWLRPVESTCSLLADLFIAYDVPITHKMAVALAAGIVSDTGWLQTADASAFRRLAAILKATDLYLEDIVRIVDSPGQRAARRSRVLTALRGVQETYAGRWCILSVETHSDEHSRVLSDVLSRIGGDLWATACPKNGETKASVECAGPLVTQTGLDLAGVMGQVAQDLAGLGTPAHTWGTQMLGRIVAPVDPRELLDLCVAATARALADCDDA
jgi:nanoRNase/pAp phosphatase (c-di-AMP/oligoRNAs hydrolase)